MSAARHPKNAAFTGVFARLQTLPFMFVHAVSLVISLVSSNRREAMNGERLACPRLRLLPARQFKSGERN